MVIKFTFPSKVFCNLINYLIVVTTHYFFQYLLQTAFEFLTKAYNIQLFLDVSQNRKEKNVLLNVSTKEAFPRGLTAKMGKRKCCCRSDTVQGTLTKTKTK